MSSCFDIELKLFHLVDGVCVDEKGCGIVLGPVIPVSGTGEDNALQNAGTLGETLVATPAKSGTFLQVKSLQGVDDVVVAPGLTDPNTVNIGAPQVALNTAASAANTAGVATNAADIATNAADIATNAGDIAANQVQIANNAAGVLTNSGNISINSGDIGTNALAISVNTTNIGLNASAIALNTGNIATNTGDIATNQADIASHVGDFGNPHNVTAAQAGADPAGSAAAVQSNLTTHENDFTNPHNVTAAQAGADPAGTAAAAVATHEATFLHANIPTTAQKAGLDNSPTPASGLNPYVTVNDLPVGGGDVVGPAGATDDTLALFDGATGKLIKEGPLVGDLATDAELTAAISAHEAAPDPHPQYTTLAEASAVGPVLSVNTQTGAVVLDTDDVAEGGSNLYYTEIRVSANADVSSNSAHRVSSTNPHATSLANIVPGTLAELNVAVTDATLDDASDPRDPNAHAASHSQGGTDEIDAGDLASGTAANTTVLTADGLGGADWLPVPSAPVSSVNGLTGAVVVDLGNIGPGTLAELNAAVTDATLDDASDPRTPTAHAASHAQGGTDELDVASLGSGAVGADLVPVSDGAGGVSWGSPFGGTNLLSPFVATQSAAQVIAIVPTTVTFDTTKRAVSGYSLGAGGAVTVSLAGDYKIEAKVSGSGTDGDRAALVSAIYIDGVAEADSTSASYHRNVAVDEGTAVAVTVVSLTAGQVVTVQSEVRGDNISTLAGESNLIITRVP